LPAWIARYLAVRPNVGGKLDTSPDPRVQLVALRVLECQARHYPLAGGILCIWKSVLTIRKSWGKPF
jgi:hypothetical protein